MNLSKKRTKSFLVRLTEDELKQLDKDVAMTAFCREEYLRQLIKGHTPIALPSKDYRELIRQIRKIGYNIDQISKVAHTKGFIDSLNYKKQTEMLFDLCTQLNDIPIFVKRLRENGDV